MARMLLSSTFLTTFLFYGLSNFKVGSGIQRNIASFKGYGLEVPVFENLPHGFTVTVFSAPVFQSDIIHKNEGGPIGGPIGGQKSGQKGGQKAALGP